MPEMRFVIAWPDGREESFYSPSLVIRDFFEEGQTYPIRDFLDRSRKALTIASDRVEAKFGYPCSLARGQLARIEAAGALFLDDADARVRCQQFIL
ncbi:MULTISPECIES: MSMEG_0570 family nitrogen starvation response protein [unclassified Rhizobium]|uniref:MSMEG_0570 family nitrogen starvation response protein n=1 Tax=unclassified Rhizobium TaxID=2613769 RepID=UPI000DDEAD81|nr:MULTISPECIES: MSMEG_0570 family nitrogen starvation response protein [unclassified Rhizobium]MBB3289415.1 putative repeat protein (TIGR04042 family) [Rhizobium sp. BK252]MBB3404357.1 putative repeat protein (TIGR04042 family) [Rhizobium sp. BK289]MBB3416743.1 putative repeat protein (TIGR04042 family) [Rhizobium sp. BK284]MBB3484620.1 putative repeat protein (TIGR04042 family) [Rhizobium sp. BK347]MDK4722938.1 MSMEG_0570 family nitrogen starvation response protein [Rhizobium sp. CNPSo 3968]